MHQDNSNLTPETIRAALACFAPSGATHSLIEDLNTAVAEINSHRPLPDPVVQRIQEDIFYDRVHSSAVTEGNRLSRRETIAVLTSGLVDAGSRKDELEVRNLAKAILRVEQLLTEKQQLTLISIRELHALVVADLDPSAGSFRTEQVRISGAKIELPNPSDVSGLLRGMLDAPQVVDLLDPGKSRVSHALQIAAWLHWAFSRIHPFTDGNGRVARLLQDYVLVGCGLVPSSLGSEDRDGPYYEALEKADFGNGDQLLEIIGRNSLRLADRYLAIIREFTEKDAWLTSVTAAATERVRETNHRRFLGVQRSLNLLKSEFASIAESIDRTVPGLSVKFRNYGGIDFDQFTELESKGRSSRTWLLGVEFRIGESELRYVFWCGRHRPSKSAPFDEAPSKVVLVVSAEEERDYYRLLDDFEEDRITLREVIPESGSYLRRRFDPVSKQQEWDENVSAGRIARDFFEEVLKKIGLL